MNRLSTKFFGLNREDAIMKYLKLHLFVIFSSIK